MERVPDAAKKWAEGAIGYIDLILTDSAPKEPLAEIYRIQLTNARLLMQKIIGEVP